MLRSRLLQALGAIALTLVASSAAKGSTSMCPNERQREESRSVSLPDCRAYELVSPAAKNGWRVSVPYINPDGSRMIAVSLGGFAESHQAAPNSYYEIARGQTGWATLPFVEPFGYINTAFENLEATSLDLRKGLFEYRRSSNTDSRHRSFFIRVLPGGSPVEVGPLFSPIALGSNPANRAASASEPSASEDLTHIFYTIEGPGSLGGGRINYLWPEDATVENLNGQAFVSLYEYVGTGNTAPALVGVDNAGHQISQCGTSLGFPFRGRFTRFADDELYNAISEDGSRVYFTAAGACEGGTGPSVNQLFLRANNEKTIPISGPLGPLAQGDGSGLEECNAACEAAVPRQGIFQGASKDGSKVFFLTDQPLLNGDKDTGTDLYEAEIEGNGEATRVDRLIQISHDPNVNQPAEVQGVARVAEDGSRVYFVAKGMLTNIPNPWGRTASDGADNLYVYERDGRYPDGHTAFIGALSEGDKEDWQLEDARPVDTTPPNGRFLVFVSGADLTPDRSNGSSQVFEYDAQNERLVQVSVDQEGFTPGKEGGEYGASISYPQYRGSLNPGPQPTSVSDDGAYVVFQSADSLTPHALTGYNNVYEYHDGRVSMISDGEDNAVNAEGASTAFLVGIDDSGTNIFFTTADQLVPQDGDTQIDVYSARIDGGLSSSSALTSCEGEGCQNALSSAPSLPVAGSVGQLGGEQVVESSAKPSIKVLTRHKVKKAKHKRNLKRAGHRAGRTVHRGSHR